MSCALHGQSPCPLCDDPRPAPPLRGPRFMRDNQAIDGKGNPLPYTSAEIDIIMQRALRDGDVMAAILRMPSGDLAVQVFGPPSLELLEILETTTRAYRRTLQGPLRGN